MASFVHGWRWYTIVRCTRTEELTLRGTYGMHVHTNPSPHAACRGANYAMWMTPEAKERVQIGEKHDPLDAPLFDCSCFVAGTPVLTADFRWVPIESLQPGDEVIGFNHDSIPNRKHAQRLIQPTRVTRNFRRIADVMRVRVSGGREVTVTADHQFLIRKRQAHNHVWKSVGELQPGDELVAPYRVWDADDSYEAGWLAGMYDGEGTVDRGGGVRLTAGRLTISQKSGVVAEAVKEALTRRGFLTATFYHEPSGVERIRINGGLQGFARFVGLFQPIRLLQRLKEASCFGALQGDGGTFIESVSPSGKGEVFNIGTESGAYFANGLAVSNCGFYSYRLFQGVAKDHQINSGIIAHVTAIEKVILHEEGFRAQMYHLDYFLEPVKAEQEITVFNADAGVYNPYGIAIETVTLRPAMVKIAESLNVPILEKDDLAGCPDCLIANSWRSEKEITAKMRKDWYGG